MAVTFVSVFVMVPIRKISSVPLFVYPGRRGGWKIRVGDGLAGDRDRDRDRQRDRERQRERQRETETERKRQRQRQRQRDRDRDKQTERDRDKTEKDTKRESHVVDFSGSVTVATQLTPSITACPKSTPDSIGLQRTPLLMSSFPFSICTNLVGLKVPATGPMLKDSAEKTN